MFPRLDHHISGEKQVASKKFLVRNLRLELVKDACRNCGTCLIVCPNDVITKGAPGASVKKPGKNQIMAGVMLNPGKCSYCGVCSYMCPYDALHLYIDGEQVAPSKLQLVQKQALPALVVKEVPLKDGKKGRQYMDGHLEYSEDSCMSGCRTCVEICPTGALNFAKKEAWEKEKFMIDREKCMYCGGCAFSCPTGAIKIFRDKVHSEGKFLDPFWPNIVKRLVAYHGKQ